MDSSKLAVKFFFQSPAGLNVERFVPVFHRWIQSRALEGHQLIDVADYSHVHQGPGTVLISHEANLYTDSDGGRPGLRYVRKAPLAGSLRERLRGVFTFAIKAALLLEEDPGLGEPQLRIRTDELVFSVNDRLHAPNTPETFAQVRGELEAFLKNLYGVPSVELTHKPGAERLFEVDARAPKAVPLSTLLERVAAA